MMNATLKSPVQFDFTSFVDAFTTAVAQQKTFHGESLVESNGFASVTISKSPCEKFALFFKCYVSLLLNQMRNAFSVK